MADVSISMITIFSFVFGAISGASVLRFITGQKNKYQNETFITRAENSDTLNIKLSGAIADLEIKTKEMAKQIEEGLLRESQLKAEMLTRDAENIKRIEEEKKIAFEAGGKESLKDYKITCKQFFSYDDGFFSKHAKGGYKFQLFVKGIPVFSPIEIVVHEEKKFDDNVKQSILNAANQAIAIAGTQLGGIPFEQLPGVDIAQIK